ncbi:MAG: glycyl-radical enzyme activating protein, partial [Anaerolineae bacterium]|nr:glycyl-radical enzyme activating protein [Anaerolineae bacterium]
CAEVCFSGARELVGREITVAALLREIERDTPFHDASGGGVTFSGGEPLLQVEFLAAALRACREREIHTVVDTCGFAPWEAFEDLWQDVQLFLYDLKVMDDIRHQRTTGASNALILRNLRALSERGAQVIVRVPLIPGINDDVENLQQLGAFIASLPRRYPVELLGYHDIAGAKYAALGRAYALANVPVPTPEVLEGACKMLAAFGLEVGYNK